MRLTRADWDRVDAVILKILKRDALRRSIVREILERSEVKPIEINPADLVPAGSIEVEERTWSYPIVRRDYTCPVSKLKF